MRKNRTPAQEAALREYLSAVAHEERIEASDSATNVQRETATRDRRDARQLLQKLVNVRRGETVREAEIRTYPEARFARSGETKTEAERRAKGQRLLQVRLGADDALLLDQLPLPGEAKPDAVRRAIRTVVASQVSSKSKVSEKSTGSPK